MDSKSEDHICKTCTKNQSNYFVDKADILRHEEQCQKFWHLVVPNQSSYTCSICGIELHHHHKILQHVVESHNTPNPLENSSKPEENSNEVSEKIESNTDEPAPNPRSTELPKESNGLDSKRSQWEQELKNNGMILCDCKMGFIKLKGKNLFRTF